MHDPLDIDDGLRLQLVDLFDDLAVFPVVILRVRDAELIDPDAEIDLPELCLGEKVLESPLRGFFAPGGILHLFVVKKIIDARGLPRQKRGHRAHIAVFIQADCAGIPHKKRIREIAVLYLLQAVIDPVGGKKSFCVRIVNSIVRRQVSLLRNPVVLRLHDPAAGGLRDL